MVNISGFKEVVACVISTFTSFSFLLALPHFKQKMYAKQKKTRSIHTYPSSSSLAQYQLRCVT